MSEFKMKVISELPKMARGGNGRGPSPVLAAAVEVAKQNAGQWVEVAESNTAAAASTKVHGWKQSPVAEGCEFTTRTVETKDGEKKGRIYCRYTPSENGKVKKSKK